MSDYTVLLTGANGFLGSSLKEYLQTKKVNVETASIRTKNDIDNLIQMINTAKVHYKILNAGWSGVINGSLNRETQNENLELQEYLFKIADSSSVLRFINFGSYNEYGSVNGLLTEDITDLKPVSEYAIVKNALRESIENSKNAEKYLHIRIANVYGPRQPSSSLYGTLLRYSGKPLYFGAGNALRDLLYIGDFCNAILHVLGSDLNGVLNIGSGISVTNKDFIIRVSESLKIPNSQLHFDHQKRDNIFMSDDFTLSIDKVKTLLGWSPDCNY